MAADICHADAAACATVRCDVVGVDHVGVAVAGIFPYTHNRIG